MHTRNKNWAQLQRIDRHSVLSWSWQHVLSGSGRVQLERVLSAVYAPVSLCAFGPIPPCSRYVWWVSVYRGRDARTLTHRAQLAAGRGRAHNSARGNA